jgi:hypothetical protein
MIGIRKALGLLYRGDGSLASLAAGPPRKTPVGVSDVVASTSGHWLLKAGRAHTPYPAEMPLDEEKCGDLLFLQAQCGLPHMTLYLGGVFQCPKCDWPPQAALLHVLL